MVDIAGIGFLFCFGKPVSLAWDLAAILSRSKAFSDDVTKGNVELDGESRRG